jgi:uncharacterized membrane protein YcaP (DUF421 family)
MEFVLRAAFLYFFILIALRITGKRTLAQITTFDVVLLLLIAESTDNSIIGDDHSVWSTVIVIITFIVLETILTLIKNKWQKADQLLEGSPVVIVENGKIIQANANKEKVDEDDVLQAARKDQGLERLDQIKYAILEKNGGISIIPK